jgi:hypothetical protein
LPMALLVPLNSLFRPSPPREPRHGVLRLARTATIAGILLCGAGCGPSDPLETRFKVQQAADYDQQRSLLPRGLSAEQLKDFDDAVLALKYDVMTRGEAKGSDAVMEQVVTQISGKTLREILGLGWSAKLHRLEVERVKLQELVDHNARLKTRPGDTASSDFLNSVRDEHARRVAVIVQDQETARRKLAELGVTVSPHAPATTSSAASPSPSSP